MKYSKLLILIFTGLSLVSYKNPPAKTNSVTAVKHTVFHKPVSDTSYQSGNLIIRKLSAHIYQHISFLNTESFGRVECNGMVVVNGNKAVIFDTPTSDTASAELIDYLVNKQRDRIIAVIPTHFHEDCVGGLEQFEKSNITCYASNKTIALLKAKGRQFSKPIRGFDNNFELALGNKKVVVRYFGEGHTKDNVVGYFAADKAVFGGCLIKELEATKGYLGDANIAAWSETVTNVKQAYPDARIVIPGHGEPGGTALFDYTIKLFLTETGKTP
ncbi:MAG: subclass B1 metallo-beta-lactamase [Ferruginibacter sp.]